MFDANGKFIADWKQFGRPSGVFVDANDVIYVADSQTTDKTNCAPDPGCRRGIRIGTTDGVVKYSIPRPDGDPVGPEGVTANSNGTVYGASNEGRRILSPPGNDSRFKAPPTRCVVIARSAVVKQSRQVQAVMVLTLYGLA